MTIPLSTAIHRVLTSGVAPERFNLPRLWFSEPPLNAKQWNLGMMPHLRKMDAQFLLAASMSFPCPGITIFPCSGTQFTFLTPLPCTCLAHRCVYYMQAEGVEDQELHICARRILSATCAIFMCAIRAYIHHGNIISSLISEFTLTLLCSLLWTSTFAMLSLWTPPVSMRQWPIYMSFTVHMRCDATILCSTHIRCGTLNS